MELFLGLLLLIAPAYVWRFDIFGIPTNFLMAAVAVFWVVFAGWLIGRSALNQFIVSAKELDKKLLIPVGLFFLAGVISLLVGGVNQSKLGQFIVLFVQPISVFFMARYFVVRDDSVRNDGARAQSVRVQVARMAYLFLAVVGLLALLQYFFLITLPPDWQGNVNEPKRAIGFFIHPNGLGLFLAPLLAWLLPDVAEKLNEWRKSPNIIYILAWLIGALGLFLSLSRGGWFGLAAAGIVFVLLAANKKYLMVGGIAAVIVVLVVAVTPNLRYRLILPFKGEKSSVARLSLWHTGEKMIADSPVLGKGLNGFKDNWDRYNTDPGLDHYNFPHNIVLNFWTDTGLLGVISMGWIMLYGLVQGIRYRDNKYKFALALFLVAIIIHGLIDIPYFKNDLALIFWLILGLSV